ncbi:MAG: DUF975 family protein [Ruminococcaceae bacterium]|nr:DUF975 family protein [Oscillospiraceae bacterium]
MDRALLKQNAKLNFKKDWFKSAIVTLIMFGVGFVYSLLSVTQTTTTMSGEQVVTTTSSSFLPLILSILVFSILTVGGYRYFQKTRKNVPTDIGEVAGNFKDGNYKNIVTITFLKNLKIFLWSLLFAIPGIIKTYEYYLIENILAVRPDIDRNEAFRLSKVLMYGNKMDAFVLDLSFIGWNLLSIFTLGILSIVYVNPYMTATNVEFYAYVRALGIQKGLITPMDLPDYEPPMPTDFGMNNDFGFNPQAQGYQNQYQQPPYQNQYNQGYQQNPYQQPFQQPFAPQQPTQQAPQTPFWQESNQPVGNVDTMPNEEPVSENEAKEVEFKPVDENQGLGTGD